MRTGVILVAVEVHPTAESGSPSPLLQGLLELRLHGALCLAKLIPLRRFGSQGSE